MGTPPAQASQSTRPGTAGPRAPSATGVPRAPELTYDSGVDSQLPTVRVPRRSRARVTR